MSGGIYARFHLLSAFDHTHSWERMEALAARHAAAAAMVRDVAVREALGRWVSELEPVLVYNQDGQFMGLTHAGQEVGGYPPISVCIKGGQAV